jgi:hypothetical protein
VQRDLIVANHAPYDCGTDFEETGESVLSDKKIGPKEKQPYNFVMSDDSVFAFAGL